MTSSFKPIPRPRAILFDHDGVLVNSAPIHDAAWTRMLAEIGLSHDPRDFKTMIGKTAPQTMKELLDRYRPGWKAEDYDLDALALRKNDFFLEIAPTELRLFPGVLEGLKWLKSQGIQAAVVSNAKRRELMAVHERLGTVGYFDAIISRDDIRPPKPDPTPYLFGAASLGMDPAHCVAVEDSLPGLEAALVARIPAAAVMTAYDEVALSAPVPGRPDLRPHWIGPSMVEFFEWIRSLPVA
jgi:alpha,alpha-trehalose phosphorylase